MRWQTILLVAIPLGLANGILALAGPQWIAAVWTISIRIFSAAFGVALNLALLFVCYVYVRRTFYPDWPEPRVAMRRLWCRHSTLARVKNRYGTRESKCVYCAKNMTAGKRFEDRI